MTRTRGEASPQVKRSGTGAFCTALRLWITLCLYGGCREWNSRSRNEEFTSSAKLK
ncbi:hypothetical protein [Helicobacter valdiviensis]|uniref:hypothetical protein n=1 Tax=Helicobacter valdiviensis TaxID=1458358 RepID=UPI0015EBCF73|nr:hypothetical protein [Helicobacter valdiviensis]